MPQRKGCHLITGRNFLSQRGFWPNSFECSTV
nr:MAG TPA: hypothetical protein [Caudoviricetes sp.]